MNKNLAPILMNLPGTLTFTKDGQWLHDGEPVTHSGISRYFSNHLIYSPEHGRFVIADRGRCVPVVIEDTAQIVVSVDTSCTPWELELGCGAREPFLPERLRISDEGVWYICTAEGLARMRRTATEPLLPLVAEGEAPGTYSFRWAGRLVPVCAAPRSALRCATDGDQGQ